MATAEYTIVGMTCDHCVKAVQAELDKIAACTDYQISLDSGLLRINAESAIPREIIAAAVDEAGYALQ